MPDLPPKTLPSHPDLDHLKKQAKQLLIQAREGDRETLELFGAAIRRFDPDATDRSTLTLAEAQHTLAKSYGFNSWTSLKEQVLERRAEQLHAANLPADQGARMRLTLQAIEAHDLLGLEILLGLDPSLAEGWGQDRPLQFAAQANFADAIDVLIDAGAALEPDHGWPHTPLSWSVTTHALNAARRLVERGAVVDLWCAAGLGDVARVLGFFDADGHPLINASRHGATRYDAEGQRLPTPPSDPVELLSDALYIACRNGQLEVARVLLEHGADPSFEGFARAPALHWAAFSGNHALIGLLLDHGADPNQVDGTYGCRYRQFAVRNPIEWAWLSALERALAGDPTLANEADDDWGPPLHEACARGLVQHVRALLGVGADPEAPDRAGRTALQCALLAKDEQAATEIVALLVPGATSLAEAAPESQSWKGFPD